VSDHFVMKIIGMSITGNVTGNDPGNVEKELKFEY